MKKKLSSSKIMHVLRYAIVMLILTTIALICKHYLIKQYEDTIESLKNCICQQDKYIKELQVQNNEFKYAISNLTIQYNEINENNLQLQQENDGLKQENTTLKEQNKKVNNTNNVNNQKQITVVNKTDFKSFMSYTSITSVSSPQYKLQQQAYSDSNGLRVIDGKPLVAIGTGWGLNVGDYALVVCDNGNQFPVIIGDIKDNKHTDATNKTTISNGCRCEFIVDMASLNKNIKCMGSVSVLKQYSGYVVNIIKQ